jgi:nitrous oxide reductase accessory protein NosL
MSRLLLAVVTGVLILTSCSTANEIRNPDKLSYIKKNSVSSQDSTYIIDGRIYRGMPVRHAIAALGKPLNKDTSSWNGKTQLTLTYRARPKPTRGYMKRAYVYAVNDSVTNWKDLNTIPRFDAYYEVGN